LDRCVGSCNDPGRDMVHADDGLGDCSRKGRTDGGREACPYCVQAQLEGILEPHCQCQQRASFSRQYRESNKRHHMASTYLKSWIGRPYELHTMWSDSIHAEDSSSVGPSTSSRTATKLILPFSSDILLPVELTGSIYMSCKVMYKYDI
jgi:hypothetical protein